MKKKMNELLNGTIKHEKVNPEFSHDILDGKVSIHEIYRGSFFFNAPANEKLQGVLYCTNARIGFRPDTFSGYHENFIFEADTKGMLPGDHITGDFIFQTSMGEYRLPIDIAVEALGSSEKEFHLTKEEFVHQAQEDFTGAYLTFLSKEFQKEILNWGSRYGNLYRGLREQQLTYMSLEQFLVGAGLKEPVHITLEKDYLEFSDVEESIKEGIILRKENWGFSSFTITSDAPFIRIDHARISTEEFVGNQYEVFFVVEKELLHAGTNMARIKIRHGYEERTVTVVIRNTQSFLDENDNHRKRLEITQMLSVYLDYQTEKIGLSEWIGITQNNIDNYHKLGGRHIFYDLYEAFLAVKREDTERALQMISEISARKEELKDPAMYGIYIVLTGYVNPNENYHNWVKEHLETLYLENQENWIIQWLNFRINPETIRNATEKLDLIRRQFNSGCSSPVMYLEAYKILKEEPLMLRNLENFEIHLLQFICREHILDREISGQAAQIAARLQTFQPLLFRVLCRCFEVFPTKNMLTAICNILISGKKLSAGYASWYALGIKQDVRLTGLYEYFVETAEDFSAREIPSSVRKYFIYHNTLGYVKKASFYANIIKNKENDPESYEEYRPSMERFAEQQVELGHMNQDLAVVYEELLVEELMTPALAAGLERILYSCEISCENPRIKEVYCYHEETTLEQRVRITDGRCYLQLFSPDAVLILEDTDGNRYPIPSDMPVKKMLTKESLEAACRKILEEPNAILLHDCCKDGSHIHISSENVEAYIRVLTVSNLKERYTKEIRMALIGYFKEHPEDPGLSLFVQQEKERDLIAESVTDWVNILAHEKQYEQVMDMIRVYGMEKITLPVLLQTCCEQIPKKQEEDKMLLAVCSYCFEHGTYNETTLQYLMHYYEGGIDEMKAVWKKGYEYGLESAEMEERILGAIILTEEKMEDTEDIFECYVERSGNEVILKAYSVLMSYAYFVRDKYVEASVFAYLETQMDKADTPDLSRFALMKYLAGCQERTEEQTRLLCSLVEHYQRLGICFAFYMQLPEKIKGKLNLFDKYIVEYRTEANKDIILRYQINEQEENAQIMKEVFPGVYTREFTMFYGDQLEWYFECKELSVLTEKSRITYNRSAILEGITCYHLINRMVEADESGDEGKYQEMTEQYLKQQYLVDTLFPIRHP